MFTITAVESIRITRTVDRMWVQRLLTQTHPHRFEELSALSDTDLAAELAAAAHASTRGHRRLPSCSWLKRPSTPEPAISPSECRP